jgi:hypothetical protein
VRFELGGAASSVSQLAHVEIQSPITEQRIPLHRAARYRVRLKVGNWPLGKSGAAVQLMLDQHPPILITSLQEVIRLGQLVPEDQDLAAGPHRLFAVAVLPGGEMVKPTAARSQAPFATVSFHVGERGKPTAEQPRLVYGQPRGTFNGDAAADLMLVDFFVLGARLGEDAFGVVISITGRQQAWSTRTRKWKPVRVSGLPSGDYQVSLQLIGPDGKRVAYEGARAETTITVNRDAPVAAEARRLEARDGTAGRHDPPATAHQTASLVGPSRGPRWYASGPDRLRIGAAN